MSEKILEVNMYEDYKLSKSKYALYVNRIRIAPNIRDGMKAVVKRSVYAAYFDEHMDKKRVKTAKLVGTVIGNYHPHGDVSVQDTIKVLTNDFEVNQPLFKGKGNWGNAQGAGCAAMRYTETKLDPFTVDCVIGDLAITKNIVDWQDNFSKDKDHMEPVSLAPKIPYLLINGCFGIGVGLQVSIPGHDLVEVINVQEKLLFDPTAPVVLKPKHAMSCDIVETNWKAICNKGNGKYIARATINIEERRGKPALVITALPDRVFMDTIEATIKKLMEEKKIVFIHDLLDESTTKGINPHFQYTIVLKKGTDPEYTKNFLYKATDLQKSFSVNFEVLDDTDPAHVDPVLLSYKDYILFVNEQCITNKFRLYTFKIQELKTVVHKRQAFIAIMNSGRIDEVIAMIRKRGSTDDNELINRLVKMLNITPLQASYIINQPLKKLSEAHLKKYIENSNGAEQAIANYEARIFDENLIKQDIYEELEEIKKKYGKSNKTHYIKESEANGIPEGEFKFILTTNNYVKKIGLDQPYGNIKGDMIKQVLKVDNTKSVLLFDDNGKVFNLPMNKIPLGDKTTAPIDIRTILKNATSNIIGVIYEPELERVSKLKAYHFITVLTEKNIKKLDIADFLTVKSSGLKYTSLADDDRVVNVSIVADGMDLVLYSYNKALRLNISDVPHMKRINMGMKAMNVEDPIEGLSVITPDVTHIVVVTESGRLNKFNVLALPLSARAKAGSKVIKLGKTDSIRKIFGLNNDNVIRIKTKEQTYDILVGDLQEGSSISSGEKIVKVPNGDSIIKCDLIK